MNAIASILRSCQFSGNCSHHHRKIAVGMVHILTPYVLLIILGIFRCRSIGFPYLEVMLHQRKTQILLRFWRKFGNASRQRQFAKSGMQSLTTECDQCILMRFRAFQVITLLQPFNNGLFCQLTAHLSSSNTPHGKSAMSLRKEVISPGVAIPLANPLMQC